MQKQFQCFVARDTLSNPEKARNCQRFTCFDKQAHITESKDTNKQKGCFTLPLAVDFRQEAKGQQEINEAVQPLNEAAQQQTGGCDSISITNITSTILLKDSLQLRHQLNLFKAISFFSFRTGGRELSCCNNFQILFLQKISLCRSGEFTAGGCPKGPEHQVTQQHSQGTKPSVALGNT